MAEKQEPDKTPSTLGDLLSALCTNPTEVHAEYPFDTPLVIGYDSDCGVSKQIVSYGMHTCAEGPNGCWPNCRFVGHLVLSISAGQDL